MVVLLWLDSFKWDGILLPSFSYFLCIPNKQNYLKVRFFLNTHKLIQHFRSLSYHCEGKIILQLNSDAPNLVLRIIRSGLGEKHITNSYTSLFQILRGSCQNAFTVMLTKHNWRQILGIYFIVDVLQLLLFQIIFWTYVTEINLVSLYLFLLGFAYLNYQELLKRTKTQLNYLTQYW